MRKIIRRLFSLELPQEKSAFLWGPRKVGKSYWIAHSLPGVPIIDLLKTEVFAEYAALAAELSDVGIGNEPVPMKVDIQGEAAMALAQDEEVALRPVRSFRIDL